MAEEGAPLHSRVTLSHEQVLWGLSLNAHHAPHNGQIYLRLHVVIAATLAVHVVFVGRWVKLFAESVPPQLVWTWIGLVWTWTQTKFR